MEKNYYDECILKIQNCLSQNKLDEAEKMLNEELSMPYIPAYAEKQFLDLKKQLHGLQTKVNFSGILPQEIEASLLSDDPVVQLRAVHTLSGFSCRNYVDAIQAFFDTKPDQKIQALMIDILIEQQIFEEFEIEVDGMQMSFIPLYQERPDETDGFVSAKQLLETWFENDNPALLNMCMQMLIQECFLMLPLSYEEEEGLSLALSIAELVSKSLDDGASFAKIALQLPDNVKRCVLKSSFV